ncbi:MAG: electron transport complex subunit RsxE [Acholeplasmataceae bacterium]|nr:electron transport complex subunit RsxE [Acholeplasmataceae bacterium]
MTETKRVPVKKEKKENGFWDTLTKGIWKENGIFVTVLGLCPALAVTRTFEGALGMGILVMMVLTLTNMSISAVRNFVPDTVRIPAYIIIIATEVTVLKMLVDAFAPALAAELGVFIALITVNCVVFGRAESFASKNKILPSMLDGIGVGIGFGLALIMIGFTREFLGTGLIQMGYILPLGFKVTLFESLLFQDYAMSVFVNPPGAFLVIGFILATIIAVRQHKLIKKGAKR